VTWKEYNVDQTNELCVLTFLRCAGGQLYGSHNTRRSTTTVLIAKTFWLFLDLIRTFADTAVWILWERTAAVYASFITKSP